MWLKLTAVWLVSLLAITGSLAIFTVRHLDLQMMEEETATIEDKETNVLIAQLEHQWMLLDLSGHSCKNRNKIKDVLLWQIMWPRFGGR